MSGVAGLRGSGDMSTDERPKNFRELILFRNPDGDAPIFGLSARAGKMKVDDPEFNWWVESQDIVQLQVDDSGGIGTGETTITVDSADPSTTAPDNRWGTATHLKPGDHLLVVPSADNATFDHEVIEVVSVISDTSFVATRGAQGTTPATIADDAKLLLIGSSFAEGTGAPDSVSRNPRKYNNFTQIFKDTYELTGTVDQTRMRTGNPWSNDKKRKVYDHSRAIEMSILFGRKSEATGSNGKPKRTMAGLRSQIPSDRTHVFSSAVSVNGFLDEAYKVFEFASPAGNTRIVFTGNTALNEFNKIVTADSNSDIRYGGIVKVFGMDLREFVLPQGRLLLRTHPLLNRSPIWSSGMFILDFSAIKYVYLQGRDTKIKDDVQNKDEDVRRGFIQTECSLRLDADGMTCAYIGGISST